MNQEYYITQLRIHKVRHLKDIFIPIQNVGDSRLRHLIITGKNGSGKTSVLEALTRYLDDTCSNQHYEAGKASLDQAQSILEKQKDQNENPEKIKLAEDRVHYLEKIVSESDTGLEADFSIDFSSFSTDFQASKFILAYFDAERNFQADSSRHVEKIELKEAYSIHDSPGKDFVKYLVDKKVSQSLYQTKGETEKARQIGSWFEEFEKMLQQVFEDPELKLDFDVDTFAFHILEKGREPFDFNTMSAGYAAILDIAVNLLMRMEHQNSGQFSFDMPGIVLIDELETHLHYELQKKVLPFLCGVFPHIQFIVSTHSAFILNSISNAAIYDLENQTLVRDGLSEYPYEGIIEGYFDVSTLSNELKTKFDRYKELTSKAHPEPEDYAEIAGLSMYLDEIPDYLALDISVEYQRLKLEFENREETDG